MPVEDETESGTSPAGLSDAPYRSAADAINNLATALPQAPASPQDTTETVFLRAVPAWETDALWQVHVALQRARGGEPDTAGLGEPRQEVGADCHPSQSAADIVDRLNRVLAVPLLPR